MTGLELLAGMVVIVASAQSETPPAAGIALLSAVESGDSNAARAVLADDATIADSSSGTGQESSLDALSRYGRGCARSRLSWEYDATEPADAVVSLTWSCPSRSPTQVIMWTAGPRVVWVQFGLANPETWVDLPNREGPQ